MLTEPLPHQGLLRFPLLDLLPNKTWLPHIGIGQLPRKLGFLYAGTNLVDKLCPHNQHYSPSPKHLKHNSFHICIAWNILKYLTAALEMKPTINS